MDSFVFLGFGVYAWITLITVFAMFTVLLFTKIRSDVVFLCAAGAMFFPIMFEAAEKMGYEPYPFLIALMIAVSSSFATPIGSPISSRSGSS